MFLHMNPSCILRAPEPDTDNKGGGGGGGGADNAGLSKEALEVIGGIVNAAVTSHMKRLPGITEQLKDFKWDEVLGPIVTKLVPAPDSGGKPAKGSADESEMAKQIQKLANELEASKKATAEETSKRTAVENARRHDAAKLNLRSALTGKVMDGALDHAINHLTLVQNRLNVDENGNATIKVKRPEYPGAPPTEIEVGLNDAIKDILEEADMKVFIAPPKGQGTSAGPKTGFGGRQISFEGEAKSDEEKLARAAVREADLMAKFGNR